MDKREGKPKRAQLKADRRKQKPRLYLHVTQPGVIVIDQGKRTDDLDAPPGSVIVRRDAAGRLPPEVQALLPTESCESP